MAIRRLINIFGRLSADGNPRALRNDVTIERSIFAKQGQESFQYRVFMEEAVVVSVNQTGGAYINFRGRIFEAGQATDEPLIEGEWVYVSQLENGGWLIHGSVK